MEGTREKRGGRVEIKRRQQQRPSARGDVTQHIVMDNDQAQSSASPSDKEAARERKGGRVIRTVARPIERPLPTGERGDVTQHVLMDNDQAQSSASPSDREAARERKGGRVTDRA